MTLVFEDDFSGGLGRAWCVEETASARVQAAQGRLRLWNPMATDQRYSNAQIDDYRALKRRAFPWRPPLTLTVRARFSHETLAGTAGFGFWNEPFTRTFRRWPALPQAIWFFYAGPASDMALAMGVPGWGWKAATFDARRLSFLLLAPTAPLAFALMRSRSLYRRLWPLGQGAIGVCEAPLVATMTTWRTYEIEWDVGRARFRVDGELVLDCASAPVGPLGLVIWLDNQFMVVTPQGRFGAGLVTAREPQWLELDYVRVQRPG